MIRRENRVREIDRKTSESLRIRAERAGVFANPTARGDGREDLVRDELQGRLGPTFGVKKGEVVDADGRGTGEYDAAIFDATMLPALMEEGERRIIRVESLIATLEVKSTLDEATFEQVDRSLDRLMKLNRYYQPGQELIAMGRTVEALARSRGVEPPVPFDATVAKLKEGVCPITSHMDIPAVFTAVFAFDGPSIETTGEYLGRHAMLIDAVCVLGRYTIFLKKAHPMNAPDRVIWGEGADAWGAFANLIDFAVTRHVGSRSWVRPDVCRYYQPTAEDPTASGRKLHDPGR